MNLVIGDPWDHLHPFLVTSLREKISIGKVTKNDLRWSHGSPVGARRLNGVGDTAPGADGQTDSSYISEDVKMNTNRISITAEKPDGAQVKTAKAFLMTLTRTKDVSPRSAYSYGLKHTAENWGRANGMEAYVSNDALIAAAIELDLPVLWEGGKSPNAFIGVSRASYAQARMRLAPGYVDPAVRRARAAAGRAALYASRRARKAKSRTSAIAAISRERRT